jgi:hypothetical protein
MLRAFVIGEYCIAECAHGDLLRRLTSKLRDAPLAARPLERSVRTDLIHWRIYPNSIGIVTSTTAMNGATRRAIAECLLCEGGNDRRRCCVERGALINMIKTITMLAASERKIAK